MSRSILSLTLGALVLAVGVLGYVTYQDRKQPDGLQINVGKQGLEIKSK